MDGFVFPRIMGGQEWGEPLLPWMLEAASTLRFKQMTPVQAATIPLLSGNKDVIVEAVTGSGKTLAFLLPILVRISSLPPLKQGQTNAIILAPTRELASQIHEVLRVLIELSPEPDKIRSILVVGGNDDLIADVKNYLEVMPQIVVATAGRLLQLLKNHHVHTSAVDVLILDEADRLLELGLDQTVRVILKMLPIQKRVGLFSATMSDSLEEIAQVGMRNPVKISVKSANITPDQLNIEYIVSSPIDKPLMLMQMVKELEYRKAIVYVPTCVGVSWWTTVFKLFLDTQFIELHGKMAQPERISSLKNFTESLSKVVLVTTDVAARGLDIPDVDLVLQMDPPKDPNVFVHRAGRTARAGNTGRNIVFLNDNLEERYIEFMKVRRVPMKPYTAKPVISHDEYLSEVHKFIYKDRGHHEAAVKAFVAFVKHYEKHTAKSIFRLECLDLVELARSYGLLRVPRMPELKDSKNLPENGWLVEPFDFDAFAFCDAELERARLNKLAELRDPEKAKEREARSKARKRNAIPWSEQKEKKARSAARKEARQQKAIRERAKKLASGFDLDKEVQRDWKEIVKAKKRASIHGLVFDEF